MCEERKKGPLVHPLHSHVLKFSISLFLLKPATQATMMITPVVERNERYNIFFSGSSVRLLTSAFSHMDFWHLGVNMFVLWSFAPHVEGMLTN